MFVAAVLAFCAGIYLQAVHPFSLALLLLSDLAILTATAFVFHGPRRVLPLLVPLMLVCSLFSGATRLAFIDACHAPHAYASGKTIYDGLVVESSSHVKVLSLERPAGLKGVKAAFASDSPIETGMKVRLFGTMTDLVPTFRNPGGGSWKKEKRVEGVEYQIKGIPLSVWEGNDPVARLRAYFKGNIEHSGAHHQDVLKALTIGDRTAVPRDLDALFMRTGTTHVLIVSGFKVSLISGFFFLIARMILGRVRVWKLSGRDSRYAALLTIPFPIVFMLISGSGIPVIRATIMIVAFMVAIFLEKQRHFYNTMAFATLIILLLYPYSLMTPSFQLTFSGVLAILMVMKKLFPLMRRIKNRLLAWVISTVLSTMAVTAGTAPLVIYYFCGINPLSFVHNLVTIPLLTVAATVLSLIGMSFAAGHWLLVAAGYLVDFNTFVLSKLDVAYLYPLIRPNFADILLCYSIVLFVLNIRRKAVAVLLFLVLVPIALVHFYGDYRERFNDDLRVDLIDVGLGDSIFIEGPGGVRILIDGGGYPVGDFDMGKEVITPFLLYRKVRHIDYLINTHPHSDHIGGLVHVMKYFDVSHLVTAGFFPKERGFRELIAEARAKGVDHLVWRKGDVLYGRGFSMEVLYPGRVMSQDDLNDTSLVIRLNYGKVSFLFTGDIEGDAEEKLVLSGLRLESDVLKVPHHGSASSNSLPFLYAVRPRLAILSAGQGFKHLPAPAALERYAKLSIPVLATYRYGLVEVRSDGRTITWRTYEN